MREPLERLNLLPLFSPQEKAACETGLRRGYGTNRGPDE